MSGEQEASTSGGGGGQGAEGARLLVKEGLEVQLSAELSREIAREFRRAAPGDRLPLCRLKVAAVRVTPNA